MHKITLINTRHERLGICNENALLHEFQSVKPQVFFIELPPSYGLSDDLQKQYYKLERNAINTYSQLHHVETVPVDLDPIPSEQFFENYKRLLKSIEGRANRYAFEFRNLFDSNEKYIHQYGFRYLNSMHCIKMNEAIKDSIKKNLAEINRSELFDIFSEWNRVHENRENHMLSRIYDYCADNIFEKGIFLIGASHRNGIIEKIERFKKSKELNIDWTILNYAA